MKPNVDHNGVPHCTYDECPSYDGKRCEETGMRAGGICEPAVIEMHARLCEARAAGETAVETRLRNQAVMIERLQLQAQDTRARWMDATGCATPEEASDEIERLERVEQETRDLRHAKGKCR